jgi:hypothetical protein
MQLVKQKTTAIVSETIVFPIFRKVINATTERQSFRRRQSFPQRALPIGAMRWRGARLFYRNDRDEM